MTKLNELSASQVAEGVRLGEVKAEEYIASLLDEVKRVDGRIHAFITVKEDYALERAREIDGKVKEGRRLGRLCGVGLAVKDNMCTEGIRTTCASHMLEDYVPTYDATVVEWLKREDAVILGKTNMDEYAMGSSTEYSHFGATRNPYDVERVPGGSSGGSVAAVAAKEATLALGSDTGGSIRCPASFCSVVGLKPTYGLVSRYGLIAFANSLEQIGPVARDVRDCALLLSCIAGNDPRDSTSVPKPQLDYVKALTGDVRGLKIGVLKEFLGEGVHEAVARVFWEAVHKLEELGAVCEEVSLKSLDYALAAYYIIAMSETSSNLARYDGMRYGFRVPDKALGWNAVFAKNRRSGFGSEVKRRIILGTYALSAGYYDKYYSKAQQVRTLIRVDFEKAFKNYQLLVGPSMPILPFKVGDKVENPLAMYMCDINTVPANLAGLPAISVPCGFHQGLPIGFQIMAPPFREDLILQAGHSLEKTIS